MADLENFEIQCPRCGLRIDLKDDTFCMIPEPEPTHKQSESKPVSMQADNDFSRKAAAPFKSDEEILELILQIFELRNSLNKNMSLLGDGKSNNINAGIEIKMTNYFHKCIDSTDSSVYIVDIIKKFKLRRIEREVLLLFTLSHLGIIRGVSSAAAMQKWFERSGKTVLNVIRTISEGSRLLTSRLIQQDSEDDSYCVGSEFIEPLINKTKRFVTGWDVKSYSALLDKLYDISKVAKNRADAIERVQVSYRTHTSGKHFTKVIEDNLWRLKNTLEKHPNWPLNKLIKSKLNDSEKLIVLILTSKDLGHFRPDDELFTGIGLARSVSGKVPDIRHNMFLLNRDHKLRREEYIRVCGGLSNTYETEDEGTLQSCEFELTTKSLELFKIKRQRRESQSARKPVVTFDQLIFPDEMQELIDMCLCQIQHKNILFEQWGLGDTLAYGKGVTMLFSGSPGTGKTACAEAIAHKLNKSIIAINYAEIQNCWVGQTEKNIVRAFREATESDSVLLWDEADAMFYDRETAFRNWEARTVNLLLQEIERFEGVCILSTNRKGCLDSALSRRISLKLEFDLPVQKNRYRIWKKIIPSKMPLASDVSIQELSHTELSGGEIKNVLVNAARIALKRNGGSAVTKTDFMEAIKMEKDGRWGKGFSKKFGFGT
ncbi:MAG: ATP-binding protein [Phycisphaerae bacterium]|nr:ATP-binding protein [Phycisphaerae bacterium]